MAVSREIMSIMAGIEALAEPQPDRERPLPGKTAPARIEAVLRWISGSILARRLFLRADTGATLGLVARSGRLVSAGNNGGSGIEDAAAAIVALARADGPHRIEVTLAGDDDARDGGVGHSTADLRAACTAAMVEAEAESAAGFKERLGAMSLALAHLGPDGLSQVTGDPARLPDGAALPVLSADLAALEAELAHLGGAPALFILGAADDPAGQAVLVGGVTPQVAALSPGSQARLMRAWGADLRAAPDAN